MTDAPFTETHRATVWNLIDDDRMTEAENVAIDAALAEIDRLQQPARECVWTLTDEDAPCWETACGHAFQFNDDGPVENQQKFCGYCGGTLVPVVQTR